MTRSIVPTQKPGNQSLKKYDLCWKGTIDGKIPVFVHYQVLENNIYGEILYLISKEKKPITIIGILEENNNCRILEFEKSGNITGIITGHPNDKDFTGSWFSPKNLKTRNLVLSKVDTLIESKNLEIDVNAINGEYQYQYTNKGDIGYLTILKETEKKSILNIINVTSEPARNQAYLDDTSFKVNATGFFIDVPENDKCKLWLKFYDGFVIVKYHKGFERCIFGVNATLEGIYLKTKSY